jgi:hypothetical protein
MNLLLAEVLFYFSYVAALQRAADSFITATGTPDDGQLGRNM